MIHIYLWGGDGGNRPQRGIRRGYGGDRPMGDTAPNAVLYYIVNCNKEY